MNSDAGTIMQCDAYNQPDDGTCLLRCEKDAGHEGWHQGVFGIFGKVRERRCRDWSEESPNHRTAEQAVGFVRGGDGG